MSDIISQQKNTFKKTYSLKEEFYIQNKKKISLDANHNSEILKDKTLFNSILKSKDNFTEPNNHKSNKKENNSPDKKNNQILSHFIDYFIFNEKYIKEKMPEGNNYKMKPKNYRLKNNCINLNNNKIKNVDLNKVNDILQDIEYMQNYINNNSLKNYLNIVNDLNLYSNKLDNNCKIEDNLLLNSSVNNYIFGGKLFNLFTI